MINITDIEEIHQRELRLLVLFKEFCDRHDLKFILFWGTMLGAVRHKGFIPWDDDVDLNMDFDNFKKLCSLVEDFNKEMAHFNIKIKIPMDTSDGFFPYVCRIYDNNTRWVEDSIYSPGVCIDVTPRCNAPETFGYATFCRLILKTLFWLHIRRQMLDLIPLKPWKRMVKKVFFVLRFIPKDYFYKKIIKFCLTKRFSNSNCVWEPFSLFDNVSIEKVLFRSELFNETVDCQFENHFFKIPKSYDKILTQYYGDYMQPPPLGDRVKPHYKQGFFVIDKSNEKNSIEAI